MAKHNYLKPKVGTGGLGKVKRRHGQFVNVGDYPELGGFVSASKRKATDPDMALEKGGPTAKRGKPF